MISEAGIQIPCLPSQYASAVSRILRGALAAVDPYTCVKSSLNWDGRTLITGSGRLSPGEGGRILVAGFGKASLGMAQAVADVLKGQVTAGEVICKHIPPGTSIQNIRLLKGGHPVPDEGSLLSTTRLLELTANPGPGDVVIFLISGGASALLSSPAPGLSLMDLQQTSRALLTCGASIQEMNTVRKHLDSVKGGGLWRHTRPAQTVALILSDVVGDDLDVIASGPLTPDTTTFEDAYAVIQKYGLAENLPPAVIKHIQAGLAGSIPETLKPGEYSSQSSLVELVGSSRVAAQAAVKQARLEGFKPEIVNTSLIGEARDAGQDLARQANRARAAAQVPACLIYAGETTVTHTGSGHGGRNLETALAAVTGLAGIPDAALVTLATDGEDGPTDAAGAVVTGDTARLALESGMDPHDYLSKHDSYQFFQRLGALIVTGPTGTNVNDLSLVFHFK